MINDVDQFGFVLILIRTTRWQLCVLIGCFVSALTSLPALCPVARLQVHRCRQSISFSLQCAWLLGAYSSDMHISTQRHSRGTKLRKLILSDELKPAGARARRELLTLTPFCPAASPATGHLSGEHSLSPSKRTHQRSKSDATVSISLSSNLKRTASNPKVESSPDEVRRHRDTSRESLTPRCLRRRLEVPHSVKIQFSSVLFI